MTNKEIANKLKHMNNKTDRLETLIEKAYDMQWQLDNLTLDEINVIQEIQNVMKEGFEID